MRLAIVPLIIICFFVNKSKADHIVGGEVHYEYLGDSTYKIIVKVYRDCFSAGAPFDASLPLGVFNSDNVWLQTLYMPLPGSTVLPNESNNPCLIFPPVVCVEEAVYEIEAYLPPIPGGYTLAYQRCCRNATIQNLLLPDETGATYTAHIPGPEAYQNSDPYFNLFPPTIICANYPVDFDHSATDLDGDSLVYEFCNPYSGASVADPAPDPPSNPPYANVTFANPYSYTNPLGGSPPLTIDPVTGLLTGVPLTLGQFVVGICVKEYRDGVLLSEHRRDFQFNVADCSPTVEAVIVPNLPPGEVLVITNCTNFTVNFPNNSTPNSTYHWDFGIDGQTDDTSNLYTPNFTFPDTGTYLVTLTVNPGTLCSDSTQAYVVFYPTLTADIIAPDGCSGNGIQFEDASVTTYGFLDSWMWTFGDNTTASVQDPTHVYDDPGTYDVQLIVTNNVGCVDTVTDVIEILTGTLESVFGDTTICKLDFVTIGAVGTGSFTWSPDYNINNLNLDSPLVSPDTTTTYVVESISPDGCIEYDSVLVTVVDTVVAVAMSDTVLCPGQSVQLFGSGGLTYEWSPATWLSSTNTATTTATPDSSITYVLKATVGGCFSTATVTIQVLPNPTLTLSDDVIICPGGETQLVAVGGTSYAWTPAAGLSATDIPNPIASPQQTTTYYLAVQDINSCPVTLYDTVVVEVANDTHTITEDTTIILGTYINLLVTNGATYSWTPIEGLSDPYSATPIATPTENTVYYVQITYPDGCVVTDSVAINITVDPLVIFPNAFTPNGDGVNPRFRPFVLGLVDVEAFRIYNRWGQLVHDSVNLDGWDGTFNGVAQGIGTYAYYFIGKGRVGGTPKEFYGNFTLMR